jgi:hypothetical protein
MKTLATIAALAACLAMTPEDTPTPTPYEPTDNPAQRVREFIQGERDTVEESDIYSPTVPESLRKTALELTR